MPAESKSTTKQDEIRRWAEERDGYRTMVRGSGRGSDSGIRRIDFPGYPGEDSLEKISWDEFFQKFGEKNLDFLSQDKTSGGETSRFYKLISRRPAGGLPRLSLLTRRQLAATVRGNRPVRFIPRKGATARRLRVAGDPAAESPGDTE